MGGVGESRKLYNFEKDGFTVAIFLGNAGEKYNGVLFEGRSAKETIAKMVQVGTNARKAAPLSAQTIEGILEANRGNSTWQKEWQFQNSSAGGDSYAKWTANKTRKATITGDPGKEIYSLAVEMRDVGEKTTGW